MIIRLKNYELGKKIVSLSLTEDVFQKLKEKKLAVAYLCDNKLIFWPENEVLEMTLENVQKFKQCDNYDVIEISEDGNAFIYYSNDSLDNAIITTNKCNSNCIMCPVVEYVRKKECNIIPEDLLEIIKHIPSDTVHLTITGGEPFLIGEKIFDILVALKKQCENTGYLLLTNGRALSYGPFLKKFCESAPHNISIGIPLHGYNASTHDAITRSLGGFKQTYMGIKNLINYGFNVELRMVVSKLNYKYIDKIAELIVKEFKDVNSVKIMGLEMLGNAAKNCDDVWISYSEAFKAAKKGIDILIKNGIDTALYYFPLCAVEENYHYICSKSITDYKVRYTEECDNCYLKDACGGIFAGTIRLAKKDVKAWGCNDKLL